MQFVASAVSAFALLAHAVLGCCWHHAHAADSTGDDAAAPSAACCHEHGCHAAEPAGGDHHEQSPCDDANCSFASDGARTTVHSPLHALVLPVVELIAHPVRSAGQMADGGPSAQMDGAAIFILHQRLVI